MDNNQFILLDNDGCEINETDDYDIFEINSILDYCDPSYFPEISKEKWTSQLPELFKKCEEYAKLNNKHAIYHLARMYYHGYGVTKSVEVAEKLFLQLSELKCPSNCNMICSGYLYYLGEIYNTKNEFEKAFEYFMKSAEKYIPYESYYMLGNAYANGIGVSKDIDKAFSNYSTYLNLFSIRNKFHSTTKLNTNQTNAAYYIGCYNFNRKKYAEAHFYLFFVKIEIDAMKGVDALEKILYMACNNCVSYRDSIPHNNTITQNYKNVYDNIIIKPIKQICCYVTDD
ncbi:MAG: hypothetical protein Edafosvirus21_2 [Edafosvirus sp.]|uniref:Uncharacterized protein n=1 Tax=Edafosvirus sp. TaxID=2487765 RepID=A0A3G4ZYH3_9VIRU|nr:MAG: hypothetical protein Edafosvirus21_2 [Edafosvirus sp.]